MTTKRNHDDALDRLTRIRYPSDPDWPSWAGQPGDLGTYRMVRLVGEDQWLALIPLMFGERVAVCTPGGVHEFWDYDVDSLGDMTIGEVAFTQFPDMDHSPANEWNRWLDADGVMHRLANSG